MRYFLLLFTTTVVLLSSCHRKGCTDSQALNYDEKAKKDDGSCAYEPASMITLNFLHYFDAQDVHSSLFEDLIYTNEAGTVMSITKLKYHISDFRLFNSSGDSVVVNDYHFVDLSVPSSIAYTLPDHIAFGTYTALAFNIGFTTVDNVSGAYSDLNAASWGWPESLGGGYHQLQLEGRYIDASTDTVGYTYHSGSTVREISGIDTTFHENHIYCKIDFADVDLTKNATIELKMNVAEWFKNPNTWDLNTLNNGLMSNYNAQILMRENGSDVFTIGQITQ